MWLYLASVTARGYEEASGGATRVWSYEQPWCTGSIGLGPGGARADWAQYQYGIGPAAGVQVCATGEGGTWVEGATVTTAVHSWSVGWNDQMSVGERSVQCSKVGGNASGGPEWSDPWAAAGLVGSYETSERG